MSWYPCARLSTRGGDRVVRLRRHHLPTANASPVACGRRTNRSAKTRFSSESLAVGSDRLNHGAGPGRSSPQPVRLYDSPASGNCYKARLLLALLDQPYERVPVDTFAGDTLTTEFGRLNPARETPILELDGGEMIVQSNAVLWYLGEGSEYLPGVPRPGLGGPMAALRAGVDRPRYWCCPILHADRT